MLNDVFGDMFTQAGKRPQTLDLNAWAQSVRNTAVTDGASAVAEEMRMGNYFALRLRELGA